MRFDWVELIPVTYPTVNGRQTAVEGTPIGCWAKKGDVKREEFYKALMAGTTVDAVFNVSPIDFTGQERLEHNNTKYDVVRSYEKGIDSVDLTCRRRE